MQQQGRCAIIFDFDGTIVDSLPAVIKVFEDITGSHHRFSEKDIAGFRHLSLPALATELKVPRWKTPYLMFRGRRMLRHHLRSIDVHAGMPELLEALHAAGHKLFVLSSNSKENVSRYLGWHNLDTYFTAIYGGASLLGKAPKLRQLVREQKLDIATTWYVGDETRDVVAAKTAGLHSAAVSWGYNSEQALAEEKPDKLFTTGQELQTFFS